MKILLLGAAGQVGFELQRALAPLGDLLPASRDGQLPGAYEAIKADLADPEALVTLVDTMRPDILVNAAAYTAVDRAEDEPEFADGVNHQALALLGAAARRCNALLLHYSTDYVFAGDSERPYREDDAPGPLGVYGRSKLDGENALRASGCAHLILRTAWVYGARGKNFLNTMLRLAAEREQLRVVDDQLGAPTSSRLIAATTATVLARWQGFSPEARAEALGTYHLSASGACSWFEFAQAIIAKAFRAGLLVREPEVVPISSAEFPTRAQRPRYSVLDTAKLRGRFALNLPSWKSGLAACIGELAEARRPPT